MFMSAKGKEKVSLPFNDDSDDFGEIDVIQQNVTKCDVA